MLLGVTAAESVTWFQIQIQICLFDVNLQNQTRIDAYILNFDACYLSMVKFHSYLYGGPY